MKKNLTDFFIIEMLFVTLKGIFANTNHIWNQKRNHVLIKVFTKNLKEPAELFNQNQV